MTVAHDKQLSFYKLRTKFVAQIIEFHYRVVARPQNKQKHIYTQSSFQTSLKLCIHTLMMLVFTYVASPFHKHVQLLDQLQSASQ